MKKFLYPILLFIFSALLIFYKFNDIPKNISFDEVAFAHLALELGKSPYTPYSPEATGHSTLYFYALQSSLKIFGVNNFGLRFPSALFGIFSVILFFFTAKLVFPKRLFYPLLASAVLLTSHWYLNFARFSFEATFLLALELAATLFFLRYLKSKKMPDFVGSAIFAGLAFHSYTPGRIFFLVPLIFLLNRKTIKKAGIYLTLVAIVALPLILYFAKYPDVRLSEVSYISDSRISTPAKLQMLGANVQKTLLMFHFNGDMNGRHNFPGKPALNPIIGLLLLAGAFAAVKKRSDKTNQYMLLYLFVSLVPTLLTYPKENPNMLRTFTAIIPVVYFITLAIQAGIERAPKRIPKILVFGIVTLLITVSSLYELRTYFTFQSRVFRNSFEVTCSLKKAIKYAGRLVPKSCRVLKNEF